MVKQRNIGVDLCRFFFAFCVVLIHVPMHGQSLLTPIFRCAVPFFYIVSGYFLYDSDEIRLKNKMLKNAIKWMLLYIKYFVIITIISIAVHIYLEQPISFNLDSVLEILSGQGVCKSLDVVQYEGESLGMYVLWFLVSGGYVFFFYFFCNKLLRFKYYYYFSFFCVF